MDNGQSETGQGCRNAGRPSRTALYENNFEKAEAGKLPDEFMVLGGEFVVKARWARIKFLELPGAPLDSFAVQFGPAEKEDVAVGARILSTAKGRRTPTFGVGLGGVAGYKLQVVAGQKSAGTAEGSGVEDQCGFDWKSGAWTQLRLQIRKVKEGEWKIEGKAWSQARAEPKEWMISFDEKEEPVRGKRVRAGKSVCGNADLV